VLSVGIASISYDDESRELINMRNKGAMLGDPAVREGYVQGSVARGMEAAGSNANGSAAAFMGMGIGMNAGGGFMAAASESNRAQMAAKSPVAGGWTCSCGASNNGNFCSNCGSRKPASAEWTCECGASNNGNFCANCGKPKPAGDWFCTDCGTKNSGNFCSGCGKKRV
jgi:membrane protease subunit (stomatin/prohibitin family)